MLSFRQFTQLNEKISPELKKLYKTIGVTTKASGDAYVDQYNKGMSHYTGAVDLDGYMRVLKSMRKKLGNEDDLNMEGQHEEYTFSLRKAGISGTATLTYFRGGGMTRNSSITVRINTTKDELESLAVADSGPKTVKIKYPPATKVKSSVNNIIAIVTAYKKKQSNARLSSREEYHFGKWDDSKWTTEINEFLADLIQMTINISHGTRKTTMNDVVRHFKDKLRDDFLALRNNTKKTEIKTFVVSKAEEFSKANNL